MKKTFISILFLLLGYVLCAQTTWYVSTTGSDASGLGTEEHPWRTLHFACANVTIDGDIIEMGAGSFTESSQINVADGISIRGQGIDVTVIHSSYASGPLLKLESYGQWGNTAYGNQSISYLTMDGDLVGYQAITVNFRSNVSIHHCSFIDFYYDGVIFYGQASAAWGGTHPFEGWKSMPSAWCTGNKVYNCIFTNCAVYTAYEGRGNLRYGQQDGFECYSNTITQTARAAGSNGYGIKFYQEGWNKNTDMHHNTITVARRESGKFNFSIENWNDIGGCEYYNNTLQGQFDFTYTFDLIGAGYGSWIHHNTIGFDTTPQNTETGVTPEAGLVEDCIISHNIFKNLTHPITLQHIYPIGSEHPNPGEIDGVWIYGNLFYNLGESSTEGRWTYGSITGIGIAEYNSNTGNTTSNVYIYNNTIVSSGQVRADAKTYQNCGIGITGRQVLSNIQIKNNIIRGFRGATMLNAAVLAYGTQTNTNLNIEYNDLYDNANTTLWDDLDDGQFTPGTGYTYANNITTDPLFVGAGSYMLDDLSPCIGAGTAIVFPMADYDLADADWGTPPSIGCYESEEGETPIPPVESGFLKYWDGTEWIFIKTGNKFINKQ